MAKYSNYISYGKWDEDNYPEYEEDGLEYIEDYEEENDTYDYGYSPVQGNWDPRDYEDDDGGYQRTGRKFKSVKSYDEQRDIARQNIKKKRRKEAKAKEKERQKYYHYTDEN